MVGSSPSPTAALETLSVLVLSTSHITQADTEALKDDARNEEIWDQANVASGHYGFWVYAPDKEEVIQKLAVRYSKAFLKALRFARSKGFSYINFDQDGPVLDVEELEAHDW